MRRSPGEALVPAATARGVLAGLEALGLDANRVARRAGLSRRELDEVDAMVAAEAMRRLWVEIFALRPDEAWPTRVALAVPFGAFGLLEYAAASASRVGELLHALVRSFVHVATDAVLEVDRGKAGTWISVVNARGFEGSQITDEFTVAMIVGRLRQLARAPIDVRAVALTRPHASAAHERLLGTRVVPGAARAAIHLAPGVEVVPLTRPDPALAVLAAQLSARLRPPSRSSVAAQVRARLHSIGLAHAKVAAVAEALAMSERTLLRRLEQEGTTFRALLGEARRVAGERLLWSTTLSLAQIADALGYADQSTWTRAFTHDHGASPAVFRRRARASRSS